MTIVNQPFSSAKIYDISMGDGNYLVHANNEEEAVELMAEHIISHNRSNWCFDAIINTLVKTEDMRYCPKHNIYLPDFKIQEVII